MSLTSNRLRAMRSYCNCSQSKLSKKSKVSRFKISSFELGYNKLSSSEEQQILNALKLLGVEIENDFAILLSEEVCNGEE